MFILIRLLYILVIENMILDKRKPISLLKVGGLILQIYIQNDISK
jgi:hypothetical protein